MGGTPNGSQPLQGSEQALEGLWAEIRDRMGTRPSFFTLSAAEPRVARALFELAKLAYLDNPLPADFKERLFTYLSRFCPARYCVARHSAFLLGRGYVAGDPQAPALDARELLALLEEPLPERGGLGDLLQELAGHDLPRDAWPEWDSRVGWLLRVACSHVFLEPDRSAKTAGVLRRLLGAGRYEQLMLLLAFVRAAHFWTEVHPEVRLEEDVEQLLAEHEALVAPLLDSPDVDGRLTGTEDTAAELEELRETVRLAETLRQSEDENRFIWQLSRDLIAVTSSDGRWIRVNPAMTRVLGWSEDELLAVPCIEFVHPDDVERSRRAMEMLAGGRALEDFEHRLRCRDGSYRWISWNTTTAPDGDLKYCVGRDMTERRAGEEALRRREQELATVMDNAASYIYVLDTEGRFQLVNRAYEALVGRTREELRGLTLFDLFPADAAAAFQANNRQVMQSQRPVEFEERTEFDGEERVYTSVKAPLLGEDGEPWAIVGISTDITARSRAEDSLRRQNAEHAFRQALADALRGLGDPREVQERSARLLGDYLGASRVLYAELSEHAATATVHAEYVRDGAPSVLGTYTLSEFGAFVSPTLWAGETLVLRDFMADPSLSDDERARYAALRMAAHVTVPLFRGGRFTAFVSVHQTSARDWSARDLAFIEDVAERVWLAIERARALRALRSSEEHFHRLADSLPQLVWLADAAGTVEYYNARGAEYEGLERATDGGWTWQPVVHPDELGATLEAWHEAVASRTPYEFEHRIRMADGAYRWHLSRAESVETEGTVRWYGTATDIHELKLADELKNQFLSIASHELRNPVAAIYGLIQRLQKLRNRGDLTMERVHDYLDLMSESGAYLADLTNELMDVARLQRGTLPLNPEPTDLATLLAAVTAAEEWPARVRRHVAPDVPPVSLDPHRVRQVLSNLVSNALKYSPEEAPVDVRVMRDDGGVLIEVEDRGIGLAPEALQSIFQPFGRAVGTGTVPGLGMGLYIAREIAERHGGRLWAESAGAGRGTSMWLWLPLGGPVRT